MAKSSFLPEKSWIFYRRWHSPPFHPRGPEHPDYRRDWNNQPNLECAQYGSNFNHGGYHSLGIDTAARYSLQVNDYGAYRPHTGVSVGGHGSVCGGRNGEYGVRSNYSFGWGHRPRTGGSVTDRYAPRLEETNNQPRGRPMF
uniref:Uncharacterized protein n=1 Tax=Arundo donax TaxID=35708 RepID=A0A0A9G2L0_ARUDO